MKLPTSPVLSCSDRLITVLTLLVLFFFIFLFFWVCSWFDDGHLNVNYSFVFSLVVLSSGVTDAFLEIRTVSLQPTAHVHDQLSAVGRRSIGRLILPSQVSAFVV
jgi:hypothetical protein